MGITGIFVTVNFITNSHRAKSFLRAQLTPVTPQIPYLSWNSEDHYTETSILLGYDSVTYQKNGILNHTTVKTSKLAFMVLILACCRPFHLVR